MRTQRPPTISVAGIIVASAFSIKSLPEEAKEAAQIQMRKLYTACSRAREVLYVLSDAEDETIIDDIIRNGVKRK